MTFLPNISQLTEPTSIALAQSIQRQPLATPLSVEPILTTFVHQGVGGVPILLLHGFDSSVFEFRRLLPLLAIPQGLRRNIEAETWAIDLLGFGFTDRPTDIPFSPAAIKTHLYAFWEAMIAQPVILVGASMGGAAAIDFALTYPEAVHRLVLIDSAGFAPGSTMGKYLIPPLGNWATAFLRSPNVRQSISRKAYHDPTFASADAQTCAALHLQHPQWQRALIAFTCSGGYQSFADRLSQIQPPTLILWGKSDRILGIADAAKLAQAIPHSKLVWIDRSGHVPHLEQPQVTAEAILAFRS